MSRIEVDRPSGEAHARASGLRRPFAPIRVWVLALVAGSIAGLASWLIGEVLHPRFDRPAGAALGPLSSAERVGARFSAERDAQELEAILNFGSLGGILGLVLGLAGGAARGSARAALGAAIVGWLLGGAFGAGSSKAILPIYFRILDPDHNDLVVGIMTQAAIAAAVGAAGGTAFGIGLGHRNRGLRALLGGLLGAIAGALVYEIVGALAFPLDATSKPIAATWGARLFARLAVTTLISAGVASGVVAHAEEVSARAVRPEPES
jgi:hypothetical protein